MFSKAASPSVATRRANPTVATELLGIPPMDPMGHRVPGGSPRPQGCPSVLWKKVLPAPRAGMGEPARVSKGPEGFSRAFQGPGLLVDPNGHYSINAPQGFLRYSRGLHGRSGARFPASPPRAPKRVKARQAMSVWRPRGVVGRALLPPSRDGKGPPLAAFLRGCMRPVALTSCAPLPPAGSPPTPFPLSSFHPLEGGQRGAPFRTLRSEGKTGPRRDGPSLYGHCA